MKFTNILQVRGGKLEKLSGTDGDGTGAAADRCTVSHGWIEKGERE